MTLPNGMKVVLLPKKTRGGTVVVQGSLHFGTEQSLMGKSTAAQMAGALLMRGTKNKTRQQIQDEADRLKARINLGGSATMANISIETVEAGLAGSLKLAAECLRESTLLDSEFEEARQLHIAQIEYNRQEPNMLANIEMQHHLNPYPRGDVRYVGMPDEQIDDLKKVTPAEARQFYSQFYGASDSELVVSGQFDPAEVKKLAADLFGNWKSPSPYVRVSTPYHKVDSIDRKIETPDKQNAFFMAALTTKMSDDDPDYAAMTLANYILGGSQGGNRLFKRIRDKEGLSYGVGSNFTAPPQGRRRDFHQLRHQQSPERPQSGGQLQGRAGPHGQGRIHRPGGRRGQEVSARTTYGEPLAGPVPGRDAGPAGALGPHHEMGRSLRSQDRRAHARSGLGRLPPLRRPRRPEHRQGRRFQESGGVSVGPERRPDFTAGRGGAPAGAPHRR